MTEIDSNRLAYSGTVPPHDELARRAAKFGVLYYAETFLRQMRAYGVPIALYSIGQPLLYMVAMGVGLGALIQDDVNGVDYLVFVAPALLVSTVVMSVSAEMTFPVMDGFKWHRLYYGPAATPVQPAQIAMGHALGASVRFVGQCAIFWLVMVAFGATQSGWSWLTIPIGVLTAMAFGTPLQAYAAGLEDEGWQFAFVNRFVVMPMFLFAGTFFPLSSLPTYLHWIGWISPVWHGTELARVASYGAPMSPLMLTVHLVFLTTCVVLGLWAGTRRYTRRLHS